MTDLLAGELDDADRHALGDEMLLIVGPPLQSERLGWLAQMARNNDRHVMHLSMRLDFDLPSVAFAYWTGQSVETYESCVLCLYDDDDRAMIIPDSFRHGAFRFSSDLRLDRHSAPPSFEAATELMVSAYRRFFDLLDRTPALNWNPVKLSAV